MNNLEVGACLNAKPSVLHVITGLEVGGAERALYTLLTNGLEGPMRNRVISLTGLGHYGPLLKQAGIPVSALGMTNRGPTLQTMRKFIAATDSEPFNVIQGWMLHGNLSATAAWGWHGRRGALVWNQRNSPNSLDVNSIRKRAIFQLGAWLSNKPASIIYNSSRARDEYVRRGYSGERALSIPNGFDTEAWKPDPEGHARLRRKLGIPDKARIVGYVGRGHPLKDLDTLFSAFDIVARRKSDTYFVTVGREHEKYTSHAPRSHLLGERSDVPDLLQGFDLLCLSSLSEGFPNVIGEAMASGVPVVSTDVGDASKLIGNTGWIVPPRSPRELADRIEWALSIPAQDLRARGEQARTRIKEKYSIDKVVECYASLYNSLNVSSGRNSDPS